jgi:selenide,water dikinase
MSAEQARELSAYPILFDPQTCGGLLCGVRPDHADDLLARLHAAGDLAAAAIGRVVGGNDQPRLVVR